MSLDVEFLGERNTNCTTMSESVDAHHNTSLRLGFYQDGMSSEKENSEPKRLRPPSKYMCTPYEINKRGTIQPNIMKLYNAITTLCDIEVINEWVHYIYSFVSTRNIFCRGRSVFYFMKLILYVLYHSKWAINIDNCRVSLAQLGKSIKPGGWVDSWVINAFCRKLFRENHPKKSNKHLVFHTASVCNF